MKTKAWMQSRYDKRNDRRADGLPQLPMTKDDYEAFIDALLAASRI
jgi:methylenetetrahydrofolate--tRNA-(uracil-5-)-methyltransferase